MTKYSEAVTLVCVRGELTVCSCPPPQRERYEPQLGMPFVLLQAMVEVTEEAFDFVCTIGC